MLWFNGLTRLQGLSQGINFNTSHVMVQYTVVDLKRLFISISIHLMLWFNGRVSANSLASQTISIHLMLWFNWFNNMLAPRKIPISIHLMLWFNFLWEIAIFSKAISIHLMLWFNIEQMWEEYYKSIFQYISCYGSITTITPHPVGTMISIHLMLWFN